MEPKVLALLIHRIAGILLGELAARLLCATKDAKQVPTGEESEIVLIPPAGDELSELDLVFVVLVHVSGTHKVGVL